jgi:DNA-binding XRE family transcriptional regulator
LEITCARRLDLGLPTNWELNRTSPALRFLPHIIALLGFDPSPPPGASLGERLKTARCRAGISQKRFARLLGVDPGALSRWERSLGLPTDRYARLAETSANSASRKVL